MDCLHVAQPQETPAVVQARIPGQHQRTQSSSVRSTACDASAGAACTTATLPLSGLLLLPVWLGATAWSSVSSAWSVHPCVAASSAAWSALTDCRYTSASSPAGPAYSPSCTRPPSRTSALRASASSAGSSTPACAEYAASRWRASTSSGGSCVTTYSSSLMSSSAGSLSPGASPSLSRRLRHPSFLISCMASKLRRLRSSSSVRMALRSSRSASNPPCCHAFTRRRSSSNTGRSSR
mmetsp:Transcript_30397/g.77569  ORF Transcript_30397/g.77569 Transcript_30397/m.77569 type:complete len:237 (+) Transcript_30397:1056-1766(+)